MVQMALGRRVQESWFYGLAPVISESTLDDDEVLDLKMPGRGGRRRKSIHTPAKTAVSPIHAASATHENVRSLSESSS